MAKKEANIVDLKVIDHSVKKMEKMTPGDMIVLIPSIALEFLPLIYEVYRLGVRNIYVYSLDQGLKYDFEQRIHSKCHQMNVTYFDLEDPKCELPSFTFSFNMPEIVRIEDKIKEYLVTEKIPLIEMDATKAMGGTV